jgi:hypothetical protein
LIDSFVECELTQCTVNGSPILHSSETAGQ